MTQTAAAGQAADVEAVPRSFAFLLVAQVLASIGFGFSTPFFPLFVAEIGHFDARQASLWGGIIAGCTGAAAMVSGPFWGIVGDWFGYKKNALRAAFAGSIIVAAAALAQNILQMAILRTLMGGFTGFIPANMGLVSAIVPRSKLAFAVGLSQGMASLGFTLGPLFGGLGVIFLGYRYGMVCSGALIGVAGCLILFGTRPPPQKAFKGTLSPGQLLMNLRGLWRTPGMKGALLLVMGAQLAPNVVAPVMVFYIKSLEQDVSAGTIGMFFTIMGLAATAAAWGIGYLSTKLDLRLLLIAASVITALGAAAMSQAGSMQGAMAFGAFTGIGAGMLTAGAAAWVSTIAPREHAGAAFGIMQSANAIGFGLGPAAGGVLAGAMGLRAPFVAEAVLAVLLAGVLLRLRRAGA